MYAVEGKRWLSTYNEPARLFFREIELAEIKHNIVAYLGHALFALCELVTINVVSISRIIHRKFTAHLFKVETAHLEAVISKDTKGFNTLELSCELECVRLENHPLRLFVICEPAERLAALLRYAVKKAYLNRVKGVRPYLHRNSVRACTAEVKIIISRPWCYLAHCKAYTLLHAAWNVVARPCE